MQKEIRYYVEHSIQKFIVDYDWITIYTILNNYQLRIANKAVEYILVLTVETIVFGLKIWNLLRPTIYSELF